MSGKEKIKSLLEQGIRPEKIAEKTGYSLNTIYTYRTMFNKEKTDKEPSVSKSENEIKKLETIIANKDDMLKLEKERYEKLDKNLQEVIKAYDKLEKENLKLSDTVAKGLSADSPEIQAMQSMINTLRSENEKLKRRNKEISSLEKNYATEKEKHELLFKYLVTSKEVV